MDQDPRSISANARARRRGARRAALDALVTGRNYGIKVETHRTRSGGPRITVQMDNDPALGLTQLTQLRKYLDELEAGYVAAARMNGTSWDDIAWPLGITRQAAAKRHAAAQEVALRNLDRLEERLT